MSLSVRAARPGDGEALHAMMMALAASHGHADEVTAVAADFESALFGPQSISGALLAELDGAPAGSALWHRSFSSFRGREVMFLLRRQHTDQRPEERGGDQEKTGEGEQHARGGD